MSLINKYISRLAQYLKNKFYIFALSFDFPYFISSIPELHWRIVSVCIEFFRLYLKPLTFNHCVHVFGFFDSRIALENCIRLHRILQTLLETPYVQSLCPCFRILLSNRYCSCTLQPSW